MRAVQLIVILLLATLPAGASPEEQPAPGSTVVGDGVIVPGQRVGSLRLTMPIATIAETIGTAYRRQEYKAEKIILYEWQVEGIWVSLDHQTRNTRVISAFGANSKYQTDRGVRLLDTLAKAEGIYGKSYKRWDYPKEKIILIRYTALGLQFGVVNDPGQPLLVGRIFQIGIFKPGDLPPVRQP